MKTRIWQTTAALLALALGAPLANAADDSTPNLGTTNAPRTNLSAPATNAAPSATPAATPTEPAPVKVIQFPKPGLPPLLDQVVRLSESGTDEGVIRAYIEKAAPPYRITGNEIVQLHDLGISQSVIMSLIEHSQTASVNVTEVISPPSQTQSPPETAVVSAPATPPENVNDFYDSLSPYGSWLDVPGYGWSWQPTVAVVNPGWRPYCDAGDWLWSDCGWYWHSDYSWGWAPFHYGRWFSHGDRGWLWCPDRVWGPSWVCWRNSASFCGWAPLPPGAHFAASGLIFHGAHVGLDFGFGLGAAHFTFVAHDHFSERHVGGHALRGNDASTAFHNTTVINNFAVGANNRVINHGIGRETIAAAAHTPIREVAVRELPRAGAGNQFVAPDRVNRVGNSAVVFRPGAQISAIRNSGISTLGSQQARAQPSMPSLAPRTPSVRATAPQHLMPNYSGHNGPAVPPNRNWNTTPSPRMTPQFQAPAYARPAAPMQSAPRTFSSAHSYSSRAVGSSTFARPSFSGGTTSRGSVSHGGTTSGHMSSGHR